MIARIAPFDFLVSVPPPLLCRETQGLCFLHSFSISFVGPTSDCFPVSVVLGCTTNWLLLLVLSLTSLARFPASCRLLRAVPSHSEDGIVDGDAPLFVYFTSSTTSRVAAHNFLSISTAKSGFSAFSRCDYFTTLIAGIAPFAVFLSRCIELYR